MHFIAQLEDISGRKLMEDRLRRLADYDSLTGARNRRQFEHDSSLLVEQLSALRRAGRDADDRPRRVQADQRHLRPPGRRRRAEGGRRGDPQAAALDRHGRAARGRRVRRPAAARHEGQGERRSAADLGECIAAVMVTPTAGTFSPRASIGVAHIDQTVVSKEAVLGQGGRRHVLAQAPDIRAGLAKASSHLKARHQRSRAGGRRDRSRAPP